MFDWFGDFSLEIRTTVLLVDSRADGNLHLSPHALEELLDDSVDLEADLVLRGRRLRYRRPLRLAGPFVLEYLARHM